MSSSLGTIERKVVNTLGRLGSLYDASRDLLVNQTSIPGSDNPKFEQHSECRVSPGAQSNGIIHLLKAIHFDDALLHSILLRMIEPSGISSFINYNQSIDENTRFLYYSYKHKDEELDITTAQIDKIVFRSSDLDKATHVITEIVWGFEILCVIPDTDHQSANPIEQLLYKISPDLQNCNKPLNLSKDEERQIGKLSDMTIFGTKTCVDDSDKSLLNILTKLRGWQRHTTFHHPIRYTLRPLRSLYKNQQSPQLHHLSAQDHSCIANIEPTMIYLKHYFENLRQIFKSYPENFTDLKVDDRIKDIPKQFGVLLSIYEEFQIKLRDTLVEVRYGNCQSIEINNILSDDRYSLLRQSAIDRFHNEAQQWLAKIKLIQRFINDKVIYSNIPDILRYQNIPLTFQDIDEGIKDHFAKQFTSVIVWYSSDRLKREKAEQWETHYGELLAERQQTPLIYVDFTQCQQKLEDFVVIRSVSKSRRNHSRARPLPNVPEQLPSSPSSKSSPARNEINVLLLGESGVGKSTFINAFVNYLIFDTLQQAEQSEPVVLIPVSFLTTTGDHFDEFTVKFGNVDANEDHEHPGQSVTQQCKSYTFDLNGKIRLRLIDTPGMGDTRGVAQDQKNIEHILTYIHNLSHLNAVCLLLKPNASQLNVFFRSCINQLFTYLTPIGYQNIIFCFTNARATFFAPGDTGSLLRRMLKQEYQDDISFEKKNTYCFDSESFRYLAASKCGITFDDFQKQECTNSWTTSVTESIRLLRYILAQQPYHHNQYQSLGEVALELSILTRPLIETLRLLLYNWKLCEVGSVDKEVILNSNPVTAELCSNCAETDIKKVGPFFVVHYEAVKKETVQHCHCPLDETHFLIEFTVKYDFFSQRIDSSLEQLRDQFHNVMFQCDTLVYYLQQKELANQVDPLGPVLDRFLDEERQISEKNKDNLHMNRRIKEELRSIRQTRQKNRQKLLKLKKKLSLDDVYKIINELKTLGPVTQQLESIKTSRQLKIEANERQIGLPSIRNQMFSEIHN